MKSYRVDEGKKVDLDRHDPDDTSRWSKGDKEKALAEMPGLLETLHCLQRRLYAQGTQSLLIILQGMDTSGKDGVIRHVVSGVNPQGCRVTSFKVPSSEERAHDFLWRIHKEAPAKGMIAIFNRSHYEDVLVNRAHGTESDDHVEKRFKQINRFEKHLSQNGTKIVKFFLHISKDEQMERLDERKRDPEKRWKFNPGDLKERKFWNRYMEAYEEALSATSTKSRPGTSFPPTTSGRATSRSPRFSSKSWKK